MSTTATDARDQRALMIAAICRIDRQGGAWIVPSQSGSGKKYEVHLEGENGTCTCPDCTEAGYVCKHIRAVKIVLRRELGMDGTVTETAELTVVQKTTYRQVWPAYNAAQTTEKHRFQTLLAELCRTVPEPEHKGKGRKPHSHRDSLFSMVFKVYSCFSSRRFACDLSDAYERGHTAVPIPGPKVPAFMENPEFTAILKELIAKSAAPLKAVETDFAVDSSGFSTCRYETWYDHKYGAERRKCMWVKCHIACGVKTNVVTAVRILDKDAADSPQFRPLVQDTAKTFKIGEVSADKGYLSADNVDEVFEQGGTPFIAFKQNSTGGMGGLFAKMFAYFQFRQEEFMTHYHKRSNVESTFSAVKRKFGDAVRSKSDVAMVNEVLCKFLAHNLCCLIQEQEELGITPVFFKDETPAPLALVAPAVG